MLEHTNRLSVQNRSVTESESSVALNKSFESSFDSFSFRGIEVNDKGYKQGREGYIYPILVSDISDKLKVEDL